MWKHTSHSERPFLKGLEFWWLCGREGDIILLSHIIQGRLCSKTALVNLYKRFSQMFPAIPPSGEIIRRTCTRLTYLWLLADLSGMCGRIENYFQTERNLFLVLRMSDCHQLCDVVWLMLFILSLKVFTQILPLQTEAGLCKVCLWQTELSYCRAR